KAQQDGAVEVKYGGFGYAFQPPRRPRGAKVPCAQPRAAKRKDRRRGEKRWRAERGRDADAQRVEGRVGRQHHVSRELGVDGVEVGGEEVEDAARGCGVEPAEGGAEDAGCDVAEEGCAGLDGEMVVVEEAS